MLSASFFITNWGRSYSKSSVNLLFLVNTELVTTFLRFLAELTLWIVPYFGLLACKSGRCVFNCSCFRLNGDSGDMNRCFITISASEISWGYWLLLSPDLRERELWFSFCLNSFSSCLDSQVSFSISSSSLVNSSRVMIYDWIIGIAFSFILMFSLSFLFRMCSLISSFSLED